MKNSRTLNGYVVIYKPEHHKAMLSDNWKGYVYEHIVIAEEDYSRKIENDEEVHHLDFNRSNNNPSNLIILSERSHKKLHSFIKQQSNTSVIDEDCKRCYICNKPLKLQQRFFCSRKCFLIENKSKLDTISLNEILFKLTKNSMVTVAKEYNISDNGLRKFLKTKYGFDKNLLKKRNRNVR